MAEFSVWDLVKFNGIFFNDIQSSVGRPRINRDDFKTGLSFLVENCREDFIQITLAVIAKQNN
jgi:hypothetical protein